MGRQGRERGNQGSGGRAIRQGGRMGLPGLIEHLAKRVYELYAIVLYRKQMSGCPQETGAETYRLWIVGRTLQSLGPKNCEMGDSKDDRRQLASSKEHPVSCDAHVPPCSPWAQQKAAHRVLKPAVP